MKAVILFLCCVISLVCCAGMKYAALQVQNGECVEVELGECYPCTRSNITQYYILDITNEYFLSNVYSEPGCGGQYSNNYNLYFDENCNPSEQLQCYFYIFRESFSYYELTISSPNNIATRFINLNVLVDATISQNAFSARATSISGVIVYNDFLNPNAYFRFEKQVSATSYSSNLGVFHFNETVVLDDFKFQVSKIVLYDVPPYELLPTYIVLTPFLSVAVTSNDQYDFFFSDYTFAFKSPQFSLDGANVFNPYFGLYNISFYPAFEDNGEAYGANIVFQLNPINDSPFHTHPCSIEYGELSSRGTFENYVCEFGSTLPHGSFSTSGVPGPYWGPYSGAHLKPDEMAFSLF